jgi:drug/metabolite transporter (DMT)-like permease
VREVSVVFGALAGWLWLGESFGPRRTLAALMIFCGILIIALTG